MLFNFCMDRERHYRKMGLCHFLKGSELASYLGPNGIFAKE
jgi:hypothetical protein